MNLITLRGGLTVRAEAIAVGCQVEALCRDEGDRDMPVFTIGPDWTLLIRNGSRLTPELRAAVKTHKAHLLALVGYVQEGGR